MTGERLSLILGAAILLLAAHAVRAFRWSLLFPRGHAEPDQRGLLLSLGIGYAVNAIIPLRIGEIVRAAAAARLRRTRFVEVLATVTAERLSDVALVTLFVSCMALAGGESSPPAMALAYAASFAALALFAMALRGSATLRRALWNAAGIFNPRIRLGIADFMWSTSEILVGGALVRWQFTVATFAMWSMYLAAYAAFAAAIGVPVEAVAGALLLQPFDSFLVEGASEAIASADLRTFVLTPVLLILGGSLARRTPKRPRFALRGPRPHFASRTRYQTPSGYDDFLDALFSDARSAVSGFGMRAVDDCIVHGFYHGGSEALTALVETHDRMLIRKFGLGTAALKLKQQADWLQRHGSGEVPLVPVLNPRSAAGAFSYDMPLWPRTSAFYETIHSSPLDDSSRTLLRVLGSIDVLHGKHRADSACRSALDEYCTRKITANAVQIGSLARSALGRDEYRINGVTHHFDEWRLFEDGDWLAGQLRNRAQATIHGDLTVENIVVAPELEDGFYLIDPNPENIFDSPLIDWAKMMQSLHLGYEALNRSAHAAPVDGEIVLPIARSEAYARLHQLLESEIVSRFSADALREVYFHELVNYLRLTPYKFRQSAERGMAFFACTSMLLRRYREAYA